MTRVQINRKNGQVVKSSSARKKLGKNGKNNRNFEQIKSQNQTAKTIWVIDLVCMDGWDWGRKIECGSDKVQNFMIFDLRVLNFGRWKWGDGHSTQNHVRLLLSAVWNTKIKNYKFVIKLYVFLNSSFCSAECRNQKILCLIF